MCLYQSWLSAVITSQRTNPTSVIICVVCCLFLNLFCWLFSCCWSHSRVFFFWSFSCPSFFLTWLSDFVCTWLCPHHPDLLHLGTPLYIQPAALLSWVILSPVARWVWPVLALIFSQCQPSESVPVYLRLLPHQGRPRTLEVSRWDCVNHPNWLTFTPKWFRIINERQRLQFVSFS